MSRPRQRGQSLVESSLVLLLFLGLLLGVIDVAQVLFAHQSLVERVNIALRWGMTHPDQGIEPVRNMVLYGQVDAPRAATEGYYGMKDENVVVAYQPPTTERPDDELLTISIVNFESHLYSPWIARVLVSPRPVIASTPVSVKKEPVAEPEEAN